MWHQLKLCQFVVVLIIFVMRGLSIPQVSINNIIYGICHPLKVFHFVYISHVKQEGNTPARILA